MTRIVALSIMLTLAAGPSATLLCRVACEHTASPQAAGSGCHHVGSGAAATFRDTDTGSCDDLLALTPLARVDLRMISGSEGQAAVIGPRRHFTASIVHSSARINPAGDRPLDRRLLITTLRI